MSSKHGKLYFNYWDARFYLDKDGNLRNKIRRGWGKLQQKDSIATYRQNNGYLYVNEYIDGKQVLMLAHRVVWLLYTGKDPGNLEINHKNQDKTDNRIQNLEILDHADHMRKQPRRSDCTSGVTGVCWDNNKGKWRVQISDCGKQRCLGLFEDFFEACCCRRSAEVKLGYDPVHGKERSEVLKILEAEQEK